MAKFTTHNADRDNVYATVRLTLEQVNSVKEFMHDKSAGRDIALPNGVTAVHQGSGWYRLYAARDYRATLDITFVIRLMTRALRDHEREVRMELTRLIQMQCSGVKTIAYNSGANHSIHNYVTAERCQPKPASSSQLDRLANKFRVKGAHA